MSLEEILTKLSTLSPTASKLIDDELYKTVTFMDDASRVSLLKEMVLGLNQDLKEIGVYIVIELDDFFENLYTLDKVLDVLEYIVPTTLIPKLKNDDTLYRLIDELLHNNMADNSIIYDYLNQLGGVSIQAYKEELNDGCLFLIDKLVSDEIFETILKACLANSLNNQDRIELTSSEIEGYTKFVNRFVNDLADANVKINNVLQENSITDQDKIQSRLKKRIILTYKLFIDPKNQSLFNFIFVTPKTTELEKNFLSSKSKSVLCMIKLHPFYFKCRKQNVTLIDILGFICFYYAFERSSKKIILIPKIDKFMKLYPDHAKILTRIKSRFVSDMKETS